MHKIKLFDTTQSWALKKSLLWHLDTDVVQISNEEILKTIQQYLAMCDDVGFSSPRDNNTLLHLLAHTYAFLPEAKRASAADALERILSLKKLDVNARNKAGDTALHLAVYWSNDQNIEIKDNAVIINLLQYRADLYIHNILKKYPAECTPNVLFKGYPVKYYPESKDVASIEDEVQFLEKRKEWENRISKNQDTLGWLQHDLQVKQDLEAQHHRVKKQRRASLS